MRNRLLFIVTSLLLSFPGTAHAQEDIGLLRALGVHTQSSEPRSPVMLADGSVVFSADDGVHGRELWRSDGTAGGTVLLADIVKGPAGSYPSPIEGIDGVAYFVAAGNVWRTDGTTAGTRPLTHFDAPAMRRAAPDDPPRWAFQPLGDQVAWATRTDDGDAVLTMTDDSPTGVRILDVFPPAQETRELELWASTGY